MKKTSLLAVAAATFGVAVCLGAGLFCPARTVQASSQGDPPVAINKTNFPDDKFREYILLFDMDGNGSLSAMEISCITEIRVIEMGITSLKGIDNLTSLEVLICNGNSLGSLDLSKNKKLVDLFCDHCNLSSLNLTSNTSLERLSCNGNNLTSLDVCKNTALTYLACQNNPLTSLDLSKNKALEHLHIYNNWEFTSLDVTNNPNLKSLYCTFTGLTSLNVTKNYKLEDLDVSTNQLTSINLRNNTQLQDLNLSSNKITSLDVSRNTKLERFRINSNPISKLDVSKNKELTYLDCYRTNIKELNISQNTRLRMLNVDKTNISVIDISHCPFLVGLVKRDKFLTNPKSGFCCYQNSDSGYDTRYFVFTSNMEVILFPSDLTGLSATSAGYKTVKLSWKRVGNADGYLIYGKKNGKYAYIGMTTKGTTFTDKKALKDDYNFYWVFPYIKSANGDMFTGNCAKYTYAKGVCLSVTNLKASSVKGGVKLNWNASTGAEGYLIYGIVDGKPYGYVGMTSGTTFTDKKASSTQYNYYWVFPYNKDENGKIVVGQSSKYTYGRALK